MSEPARKLKSDRKDPSRHPSLRFWTRADATPDLGSVCLVEHLRVVQGIRNRQFRAFIAYALLQAGERGHTRFFQRTAARKFNVSVSTIHRWTVAMAELGLVDTRKTDRELQLFPRWEALRLPGVAEALPEQAAEPMQEHSFNRIEGAEKQQQSERPPERPPAPARAAVPAAAAPCVAPVPSVAAVAEPPEAPRSLGVGAPVPHPSDPSPAPSRVVLDAGTAPSEPSTSIAVIVDPDDARIMELDGPRSQLAKCRPQGVEPPPALLAAVLREHGPDAGVDVAEILRSPEARANPRAALEALEALAETPYQKITRSSGAFCRWALREAIAGRLRRHASKSGGGGAIRRVHDAREDADQRQAFDEAGRLRDLTYEAAKLVRQRVAALEREDRVHQGAERLIDAASRTPVPRALLSGPRETPPGVPRTNRGLFRVPDD